MPSQLSWIVQESNENIREESKMKQNSMKTLRILLDQAIAKRKIWEAELKDSTNPQCQNTYQSVTGEINALESVRDYLNNNTVYLKIMAEPLAGSNS
jgi:hypothetical protein